MSDKTPRFIEPGRVKTQARPQLAAHRRAVSRVGGAEHLGQVNSAEHAARAQFGGVHTRRQVVNHLVEKMDRFRFVACVVDDSPGMVLQHPGEMLALGQDGIDLDGERQHAPAARRIAQLVAG